MASSELFPGLLFFPELLGLDSKKPGLTTHRFVNPLKRQAIRKSEEKGVIQHGLTGKRDKEAQ